MSKIIPLPQSSLYPSKRPISTSSTTSSETFSIKKDGGTRFTRLLEHGFEKFGYFAADNPKWLLILTLVFAILTSVKVPLTKQQNDLKNSHTPFGARSRDEYAMFKSFFTKDGSEPIHMIVFISSKNNQSLAQIPHLNATMNVIDDIATNFTLKGLNFYQMCTDFCEFNEPIRQFKNGLILTKNQQISSENSLVNLTFPFMSIFGAELDLSPVFFGVEKFENHDAQLAANSSANIKHLPLIVAQFKADKPKNVTKDDIKDWERSLANYYHKKFKSDLIKPQFLTVTFASDEIRRNGMTLFPFISVGFVTLLTFAILTVGLSAWYFGQWTNHKITLVFVGCVCPLLATSSALGFLFLCGFRFGSILAVTPFLILAIGK
uniref:SSD domain-containing protein n=1 Tax=Panagrolaimus sp. JU765 TaxID=591449 RepID=A0AC34RMX8_9BILA